ncbi:methyltransferase [Roseovarius aquimarinus]|uniref:Methyltransferase n=1 Tax=Roseovarius aquimarinus TaxID=1229156 RepID=A0ABW7I2R5_9RHOB
MSEAPICGDARQAPRAGLPGRLNRLLASPRFQSWAARMPLLRGRVRREGGALFDLVAGFCTSQSLMALVELRIPDMLMDGALPAARLAARCAVPPERMEVLLRANVASKVLRITRAGHFALTARGAALVGVPGLREMILHHKVLYRDLVDPAAFFRGGTETELAAFWPYVLGAAEAGDAQLTRRYSDLMAQSQRLVAEDTLAAIDLRGTRVLLDIGGGTGAFLEAACAVAPKMRGILFDLPQVAEAAQERLARAGLGARVRVAPGSFVRDPLPEGADTATLIRVLYDHSDETVAALLERIYAALPPGGRLIVSEPMTGGARPSVAGDVYFALYTMAMRTGRARSGERIAELCRAAGFASATCLRTRRPFITGVVVAEKLSI